MKIIRSISELRKLLETERDIGFVPTMGALHIGHVELIKKSKLDNKYTIVSIFVNPLQFNENKDFESYPDTFKKDIELLSSLEVDCVFSPKPENIYKKNDSIVVSDKINSVLVEGEKRPGHFDGVLTVVLKLFNIIKPQRAYFGEKDFQQLSMIKAMVNSLFLDIEVIGIPVVRDEKGLPFSSRNQKLSSEGLLEAREVADLFNQSLNKKDFLQKLQKRETLVELDYLEERWGRLLTVYKIEDVRILDNKELI